MGIIPTLNSHTHCQAAQANRTNQSLSKSVAGPTHGKKKKKYDRTTTHIANCLIVINRKILLLLKQN